MRVRSDRTKRRRTNCRLATGRADNESGPLPKSDRADELEELSGRALQNALPVERFRLRSEPGKDRGNDRYLELKLKGHDTNCRAQLQLKGVEAWKLNRDGSVSLSVESSNLNYLLNGSSPIYILWNAENNELRYAWARDECRRIESTNSNWRHQSSIALRFRRVLDENGLGDIHRRVLAESQLQRCVQEHVGSQYSQLFPDGLSKLSNAAKTRQPDALWQDDPTRQFAILKTAMLVGASVTTHATELSNVSSEQVAEIAAILKGETRKRKEPKASRPMPSIAVLPRDRSRILGIIGVSPIGFAAADFKAIFPDIDWDSQFRYLRKRNLLQSTDGKYRVASQVKRSLLSKDEDRLPYQQAWIDALEPLKGHPDTALILGVMQVSSGRLFESIRTIVDAAELCSSGRWNDTYLSILLTFDNPAPFRLITHEQRARYSNSVALCLSRAGRRLEAVNWFLRMRRFSKQVHNNWGIGQSYHNCGIVYVDMEAFSKAEYCFRQAIEHATETRNHFLLGRSLYELAIVTVGKSDGEAARLLGESEKAKKRAGDDVGMIGVYHGRAVLSVQSKNYGEALKWFTKAEKTARDVGDYYAQALEQFNIGIAHVDLSQYEHALRHLRQARKMAEEDELSDVLVLATGGEAIALERQGRNRLAEKAFRELFELHSALGNEVEAVIALHDVGALLMRQKKYIDARKVLGRASRLARRKEVLEWAYQSQADIAACYVADKQVGKAISTLRRMASTEEGRGSPEVAARLWSDVVSYSIENDVSRHRIAEAVNRCLKAADKASDCTAIKIRLYADLHVWHWRTQDYSAAIDALDRMIACAHSSNNIEMECRARDQVGVCLQEVGRFREAVKTHRKALKIARRMNDPERIETCLNNLGESLRKTGRYADAIRAFGEAEKSALDRRDYTSSISIAHNRALALEHQRRFDEAEKLLLECRDKARQRRLWGEYVRALHALANIAWHRGQPRAAEGRYARALRAADKHAVLSNRCQVCINYANALRERGQPERAIDVLSSSATQFASVPDAHLYHSELASLYGETGNTRAAAKHWRLAHVSANRVGDDDALALSAGALAEIHSDAERLEEANEYYQSALEHERDSGLRVTLLVQRMDVLLRLKKDREASQVFDEVQRLAAGGKSQDDYIDALVMMGDHNWMEGESRIEALKAYVAAMAVCAGADIERFYEIGGMISVRLSQIDSKDKGRRIAALRRCIVRWLEQEQGVDLKKENGDVLLWPFPVATRLVTGDQYGEFDEDEFVAIVEDEISKAAAPSDGMPRARASFRRKQV